MTRGGGLALRAIEIVRTRTLALFVVGALALVGTFAAALIDSRSQARNELEDNFAARAQIAAALIDSTLQAAAVTQGQQDQRTVAGRRVTAEQVARAAASDLAATIALTHHERWTAAAIHAARAALTFPVEGRIAAIADLFDTLTSDRVYRPRMQVRRAVATMIEGRGTHFDPDLLERSSTRPTRSSRSASGDILRHRGEIAQLVEHTTENRGVPGSSPGLAIAEGPAKQGLFHIGDRRRHTPPDGSNRAECLMECLNRSARA